MIACMATAEIWVVKGDGAYHAQAADTHEAKQGVQDLGSVSWLLSPMTRVGSVVYWK